MEHIIEKYLTETAVNQNLSPHTMKAYRIDLSQLAKFIRSLQITDINCIHKEHINEYIQSLKCMYKVKTIKRKMVSVKKFFAYLLNEEYITLNPLNSIKLKLKSDVTIPKTISFHEIKKIYEKVYENYNNSNKANIYSLTEVLIIELLYTTGIRVSELCNIKKTDLNIKSKTILINGKGRKERIVFINSVETTHLIKKYIQLTSHIESEFLFLNDNMTKLSTQSVRLRLKRLSKEANIKSNITPHMFRHTFATSLLEEEINLMYIQELLGHSSLNTTQIYITINKKKQQRLINKKHPRNKILTLLNKG
ncbi:hypothetical protein CI105_09190 [Candidatus Izimaplasma bacterium ZiA1]|uniref:tyrosine-type recombinase/integrase n=1 Tax=Candidatus Izimoplasma sp. ZiA1 TaxID=2024899 RepID=UPI000BAA6253|nr:hypothetical protein CI105_09190 [Candidatus Izimaplasma bacterium ZiA1]